MNKKTLNTINQDHVEKVPSTLDQWINFTSRDRGHSSHDDFNKNTLYRLSKFYIGRLRKATLKYEILSASLLKKQSSLVWFGNKKHLV